jgi:hypothetical protein
VPSVITVGVDDCAFNPLLDDPHLKAVPAVSSTAQAPVPQLYDVPESAPVGRQIWSCGARPVYVQTPAESHLPVETSAQLAAIGSLHDAVPTHVPLPLHRSFAVQLWLSLQVVVLDLAV